MIIPLHRTLIVSTLTIASAGCLADALPDGSLPSIAEPDPILAQLGAARRASVTTTIDWSPNPFTDAGWNARFVATPNSVGTWVVDARFDPHGIGDDGECDFSPCIPGSAWHLNGRATATATVTPAEPTEIAAAGCYQQWQGGGRTDVIVYAVFAIDSTGVATVSSLYFE